MNNPMMMNMMNNPMMNMMNNPMMNQMNNPMINQMNSAMMMNQMNSPIINQMNNPMINQMNNPYSMNPVNSPMMMKPMNVNNNMNQINEKKEGNTDSYELIKYNKNINEFKNSFKFLELKQKNLINIIIHFYINNGSHKMNYNYPVQIKSLLNQLNPDYNGFYQRKNIIDPFPNIKEEKKIIYFINSDYYKIKIKIPKLISKIELYSIAKLYKVFRKTNILLIHKNIVLNEDDSLINDISEEDNIIIIENRYYPDETDYINLQQKYTTGQKLNIVFDNEHLKNYLIISLNSTLSEFINSINEKYGANHKDFRFILDSADGNSIEIQVVENNNNSICMSDKNIQFKYSTNLSGNSKVIELVKVFKLIDKNDFTEYLRFIFNGEKLSPNDKVTIAPIYDGGQYQKRNFILSEDVKISEMLKAYNLLYGYEENNVYFMFNAEKIFLNDEKTIYSKFRRSLVQIECWRLSREFGNDIICGKKIKGKALIDGKNIEINVGTLNSTKLMFSEFEKYKKNIKTIYIGNIKINKDDNKNLYSLGIKKDFNCKLN